MLRAMLKYGRLILRVVVNLNITSTARGVAMVYKNVYICSKYITLLLRMQAYLQPL